MKKYIKSKTKSDLAKELVKRVGDIRNIEAHKAVQIFFEEIGNALIRGEKVEIRGLGSFKLRIRKSRLGRNPKTGEKVQVPAKLVPYFRPGRSIKKHLNEGG